MSKHLTYQDRVIIEEGLRAKESFAEIARHIGKDRSTVSREVHDHPKHIRPNGVVCSHNKDCKRRDKCRYTNCKSEVICVSACPNCQWSCPDFDEKYCIHMQEYPYGCNSCEKKSCKFRRKVYSAKFAQQKAEHICSESRKGIAMSDEEFQFLDELIVDRLKKGQSIHVIHSEHKDEMPVSERTVYAYMQQGLFSTDKLVLRRTLQRPARKKSGPALRVDRFCHKGRTYEEYLSYCEQHPNEAIVQMDTVMGKSGGKCLLTILFTNCDLQLMYLRDRNTAKTVVDVFEMLREILGDDDFTRLFQIILTDRGSEFTDPLSIEASPYTGEIDCHLFYCDPQQSNQKSNCERNHELIRYVIPKGTSMNNLTQEKVTLMMNHINSYPRKKWNDKSPYEVFVSIYGEIVAKKLGLEKVNCKNIFLRPDLIK